MNIFKSIGRIVVCTVAFLFYNISYADNFKINVFYPGGLGVDSMLQSSIGSVASPDFTVNYLSVDRSTWNNSSSLANFLISKQQSSPADGFFLACKSTDLDEIGDQFRLSFPKVPFVNSYAPALMAANIVSYRYIVITGSQSGEALTRNLISELGIENHLRFGGSSLFRNSFMIKSLPYSLTTPKTVSIQDVVTLGEAATGSHNTDSVVLNAEAIVLAGCEGFLDLGVATEAQAQLLAAKIPLQVINSTKASMGLLYSMIRNKVWVSMPQPFEESEPQLPEIIISIEPIVLGRAVGAKHTFMSNNSFGGDQFYVKSGAVIDKFGFSVSESAGGNGGSGRTVTTDGLAQVIAHYGDFRWGGQSICKLEFEYSNGLVIDVGSNSYCSNIQTKALNLQDKGKIAGVNVWSRGWLVEGIELIFSDVVLINSDCKSDCIYH